MCTAAAAWPRWGGLCRILPHLLGGRNEAKNNPGGGAVAWGHVHPPHPTASFGHGAAERGVLLGQSPRGAPALCTCPFPSPPFPSPPFPSPPPSQPWAGPGGIETEIWAGPYNETPVCRVPIPAPLLAWPHLCRLSQQQEPAPRRGPSPTGSSPPALVVPGGVLPLLLTPRGCRRAQEVLPALPGPCCFPLIIPH